MLWKKSVLKTSSWQFWKTKQKKIKKSSIFDENRTSSAHPSYSYNYKIKLKWNQKGIAHLAPNQCIQMHIEFRHNWWEHIETDILGHFCRVIGIGSSPLFVYRLLQRPHTQSWKLHIFGGIICSFNVDFLWKIPFLIKNIDFEPEFRLLEKFSIFNQNFDFWPKFRLLAKISIFN